jgi:hypothetical protein
VVQVQLAPGAAHEEERVELLVTHGAEGQANLALADTRDHIVKVNARLHTITVLTHVNTKDTTHAARNTPHTTARNRSERNVAE